MDKYGVNKISNGLYILYWREEGRSLAAVGRDSKGDVWFAPTNWVAVPWYDWSIVSGLKRVHDELKENEEKLIKLP